MRKAVISVIALLLLLCSTAVGVDPPVKLWEKWYYTSYDGSLFYDIELTDSESLFITGHSYDFTYPYLDNYVAYLMDLDGNVIWEAGHPLYRAFSYDGSILSDGSFIITGKCLEETTSSEGLYIEKLDQNGNLEWVKVYDYPDTKESGYSITTLPDGGFAVCGRVNGTGQWAGQAWILRTDASGDTLWTRKWGTSIENYGKVILFNNGELAVLTKGTDDTLTTQGPHLLFYDLDGNYLRGTDYPTLHDLQPASICTASDGGYTFTTKTFPPIWHTDQYGETLWWKSIYVTPNDEHEAFCIRQTYDSGYIFSGWDGYYEYEPDSDKIDNQEGWLVRFDSEGNELWNINNTGGSNNHYYSVVQLPEGGYIACGTWGGSGYLVRYAPETGIEEPEPPSTLRMDVSPNPCSSLLSVSFDLPEAGNASIRIFDLSGRLVSTLTDGQFPAGTNSVEWAVSEDMSSGCYLIQYISASGVLTDTIALIK